MAIDLSLSLSVIPFSAPIIPLLSNISLVNLRNAGCAKK
nr:MAG TPA: hypothetical protein [Crassvirales sp.]